MLRRKITDRLLEWKRTRNRQGLLVTGARQIGKTSSIEEFAAEFYQDMIKIDFVERPEAIGIISGATSLEDLVMRITALATRPLPDGKTLLFFDEVQRCGDAITWMRYLANDGRFDVIYSGSLLGIEAYDFRSLPVGTIDIVEMFPMDFEEFSWAMGSTDCYGTPSAHALRRLSPYLTFSTAALSSCFTAMCLWEACPKRSRRS